MLLFPFYGTTVAGMELAEIVHSVVAVLYVAAMFAHIYMGTIGVEGAFEAMATATSTSTGPRSAIASGMKRKRKAAPSRARPCGRPNSRSSLHRR